MSTVEHIGAGFMIMGLVLGAISGAIALLLAPVAIGAAIFSFSSWYKHRKQSISSHIPYPPYGY